MATQSISEIAQTIIKEQVNTDNNTSGDITLTFDTDKTIQVFTNTLASNRAITFDTSNAEEGDKFILVFYDADFNGFVYTVDLQDGQGIKSVVENESYTLTFDETKLIHTQF